MQAQQALLIGTRITDFRVEPRRVAVGESITIAGTLQWHLWPLCWWNALEGRTIEVFADTVKLGEVASGSGGGFRFTWAPTAVGVYWVKTKFPGDLLYNSCESETVRVDVITPEQKRDEDLRFWGLVGVVVAVTIAVVGGIVYTMEEERRMQLLLARRR